jgi:hypothetical protein
MSPSQSRKCRGYDSQALVAQWFRQRAPRRRPSAEYASRLDRRARARLALESLKWALALAPWAACPLLFGPRFLPFELAWSILLPAGPLLQRAAPAAYPRRARPGAGVLRRAARRLRRRAVTR